MRLLPSLVVVVLVGCVGSGPTGAPPTGATLERACPLGVLSTRVRVTDTPQGIDLDFAAGLPSQVDELRRRVRDQTSARGPNRHEGLGHGGRHGLAHEHGLRLWSMPPAQTTVAETPAGARLSLVAVEPKDRDALRDAVVRRVARLEAKGCPD